MILRMILAATICLAAAAAGTAEIVYDATTYAPSGWSHWPGAGQEYGDEVYINHYFSKITKVEIGVILNKKSGSVDCGLSLYYWDYEYGRPGEMAWYEPRYNVAISNYCLLVPFELPEKHISDHFVWTLQFLGGDAAGLSGAKFPVNVGTCQNGWMYHGGEWSTVGKPHVARITAVPEPSTIVLLALCLLALGLKKGG